MGGRDDDWVFDFALQFLESDKFDAAVMDFVDDKCDVFEADEENKFVYSDIHQEFRDHIEALITSNLGELGITPTMFYEACERGRHNRDINRAVFERLLSMEDFDTFKRIMVKRNMELQIEALTSYDQMHSPTRPDRSDTLATPAAKKRGMKLMPTIDSPFTEEEERSQLEEALAASLRTPLDITSKNPSDDMLQSTLKNSLLEMELIHRQEELEQLELEKAIALSLAIEEARLQALREEVKEMESDAKRERAARIEREENVRDRSDKGDPEPERDNWGNRNSGSKDSFDHPPSAKNESIAVASSSAHSTSSTSSFPSSSSSSNVTSQRVEQERQIHQQQQQQQAHEREAEHQQHDRTQEDARAEAKPLKPAKPPRTLNSSSSSSSSSSASTLSTTGLRPVLGMGLSSKPLPPIAIGANLTGHDGPLPTMSTLNALSDELEEKRRAASEQSRTQQQQLAEQRQKEEALRKSTMNPEEAETRARLMREQRDKLLAMKRAERDRKVQEEEERRKEIQALLDDEEFAAAENKAFVRQQQGGGGEGKGGPSDPQAQAQASAAIEEERRQSMRLALARKMKLELELDGGGSGGAKGVSGGPTYDARMAELEQKLLLADKMREEHRQREKMKKKSKKSAGGGRLHDVEDDF